MVSQLGATPSTAGLEGAETVRPPASKPVVSQNDGRFVQERSALSSAPSSALTTAPPLPSQRSRHELDLLIAAANRAVALSDTAQGLQDLVDGVLVISFCPLNVGAQMIKAYAWTWVTAAEDGATKGRLRVCRPASTRGTLRYFEYLSGSLAGAGFALALCPLTALWVASKQGVDTLHGNITVAVTRIPRGLITYLHVKTQSGGMDDAKAALLKERDALLKERASCLSTP